MYVQHEPIVIESVEYEHKGPTPATETSSAPFKSRTKTDLLDQVFSECKQAQNIKELLASSSVVLNKLNVLDLHQSAQVLLLPARGEQRLPEGGVPLDALVQSGGTVTRGQGPLRCRLLVQLTEHKPLTLRAATTHTTGVGETSLVRGVDLFLAQARDSLLNVCRNSPRHIAISWAELNAVM